MAQLVVNGAQLRCTFGVAPSALVVPPAKRVMAGSQPVATINDQIPMANIMPFGMCSSLANPQVASATSAASGVLTPQPCIPVTTGPWAPGSPTVLVGSTPALNSTCQLMCSWAGVISVSTPGQFTVSVP